MDRMQLYGIEGDAYYNGREDMIDFIIKALKTSDRFNYEDKNAFMIWLEFIHYLEELKDGN
jgi:hypothetical protein